MPVRSAAARPCDTPDRRTARRSVSSPAATPDPTTVALDEALDHIGDLAERLWAVRRLHRSAQRRGLLRAGVRCAGCGQVWPCPTLRAVDQAA